MSYRAVTDREQWNDTLLTLPTAHVLQSWDWGEVKRRHNWTPARLLWEVEGRPVAAAQVLRRPVPGTPWSAAYAPKGPTLDYTNDDLLARVLGDLEAHTRQGRALFLKIDPDTNLPEVERALCAHGWRYSSEQIQFRNTALLDITPAEDTATILWCVS